MDFERSKNHTDHCHITKPALASCNFHFHEASITYIIQGKEKKKKKSTQLLPPFDLSTNSKIMILLKIA